MKYFCGRCGLYLEKNYHYCWHGGLDGIYRNAVDPDRDLFLKKLDDINQNIQQGNQS